MIKIRFKLRTANNEPRTKLGSALIIAVILTSLLAIIGMMFVMIARVDKMSTSAISENKELNFAVESIVAKISQKLVLDTPGVVAGAEDYNDYPDANTNPWLASIEPYLYSDNDTPADTSDDIYNWRRISDIYGRLDANDLRAEIISDYQKPSDINCSDSVSSYPADADGDGVADSEWVELEDVNSNKGKPIFAAVRIVDNGAMLNVNTAYKFDPTVTASADANKIDGSSQMQINLMAFSWGRMHATYNASAETDLLNARANDGVGVDPLNLDEYKKNVVWRYSEPNGPYTPFDISDDLEMRYRFLVNQKDIDTRLEVLGLAQGWSWELRTPNDFRTPAGTGDLAEWFISACDNAGIIDPNYAYRHIATTYNMDRIIAPDGSSKMININDANVAELYSGIRKGLLDANCPFSEVNGVAAQIAVDINDYRDSDSNDVNDVTVYLNDGKTYYGFERPCVYISELAFRFRTVFVPGGPGPGGAFVTYRSYAIELYKPYADDVNLKPNQWQINIPGYSTVDVNWSGDENFHVITFQDPCADYQLPVSFAGSGVEQPYPSYARFSEVFKAGDLIELQRKVGPNPSNWITVDSNYVPAWLVDVPPMQDNPVTTYSFKRDISRHKCIRRLWDDSGTKKNALSLGTDIDPNYKSGDPNVIQAHPENRPFTNIGEVGSLFRKPAYYPAGGLNADVIGYNGLDKEFQVRLNLADPNFQQLFKYLTVFDPNDPQYGGHPAEETRVKGRININTAPWYVLAQLPWVSQRTGGYDANLAQAIVAYRDKLNLSPAGPDYRTRPGNAGFESIGQLCDVNVGGDQFKIDYYATASSVGDLAGFPDLTPGGTTGDGAPDDFEERDVIFARISNLVTVRSDVFTAYILVRIGTDGPQKRVMAILDRSNVRSPTDKVRIIAIHPVPDPR